MLARLLVIVKILLCEEEDYLKLLFWEEKKEEEEEQHFFDEDCYVVPEYVPVELIDANDVEQVSELYSSVNTGVEFFSSAAATTANVYVPTAKSQKRSSFEDFLGEFIGYEETIDDAIVPTF